MKEYMMAMALLAAGVISGGSAYAAGAPTLAELHKQEAKQTRAALETKRKILIANNLHLADSESSKFWPVYDAYRAEILKINERMLAVINDYAKGFRNGHISDEDANKMLNRYLSALQDRVRTKKKFVSKFEKILPAKKVVRFYQIDHRLDLLVSAQIAKNVPLMQ